MHWGTATPDKIAYVMAGSRLRVSYGELARDARRGASVLRAAGLCTGGGIAVLAENRIESLKLYWAAQLAGHY